MKTRTKTRTKRKQKQRQQQTRCPVDNGESSHGGEQDSVLQSEHYDTEGEPCFK